MKAIDIVFFYGPDFVVVSGVCIFFTIFAMLYLFQDATLDVAERPNLYVALGEYVGYTD